MKKEFVLFLITCLYAQTLLSCKKDQDKTVIVPEITISGQTLPEGTGIPRKAAVTVKLSAMSDNITYVYWKTKDATAKAGEDYVGVEADTLVFQPGEMSSILHVDLITDDFLEPDEYFTVELTSAKNGTVIRSSAKVTIEDDDNYTPELRADGYITPDHYPGMNLVWSDEFDGTALNTSWWTYEQGGGGWGNNELETYTSNTENSSVQNGYLTITAQKNPITSAYTSARLITKGKKEFTYGRIDIRAKMPIGQGIWPALWMLGGNISSVSWPSCGEIDIMEYLGHDSLTAYGTIHYNDNGHAYKGSNYKADPLQDYHNYFHVYSILWQENSITFFVDYHKYFEATSASIKFDAFKLPQFFIFNVAVGGNWPGNPNSSTKFPQSMIVDYVRVFQ